jgi:predicted amidohydrolase YtcJ
VSQPLCDLLLVNGRFLTMDAERPRAAALAIAGERVLAALDADDLPRARRVVDLDGACVVPGFHDAHNHMAWFGQSLLEIAVGTPPVHSVEDLYAALAAGAERVDGDGWVVANGYDENKIGSHPDRDGLDRATYGAKVLVTHTSGHMCVVSSAVLRELGLADTGRPVDGGTVVTDADGRPTGLLQERAQELVAGLRRPVAGHELVAAIERAGQHYLTEGITSVVEAGIGGGWIGRSPIELGAYLTARESGRLPVRVELMPVSDSIHALQGHLDDGRQQGLDLGVRTGLGDNWLSIGPLKVFTDGSLIGHTAAMTEDFADTPGNRGYLQADRDELVATIVAAHQSGWRVAAHAIGDAAIDLALDAYEQAQRLTARPDVRHRIEHYGVSRPDQLARTARLGVVPVPQGRFIGEIGDGMAKALGERAPLAYRLRSLLDAGLVVPGSSDRPVVDGRPLRGIHDMVNRRTDSGAPFTPAEALTAHEALHAYTWGSAYASKQEHQRGSLSTGRLADLAVLSDDPTEIDPTRIADVDVLATFIGGEVRYDPMSRWTA